MPDLGEKPKERAELEAAYLVLSDALAGAPGGTCTQHEVMSDLEWTRRHWRNAIEQWKWWKQTAVQALGEEPTVTLVIRAQQWQGRAESAEAERDEARQQLANLRAAVKSAAWLPSDEVFRGREITKTLLAILADPACGGPSGASTAGTERSDVHGDET